MRRFLLSGINDVCLTAYIFRTAAPAVRIPYDLGEGVEFLDGPLVQEIRLRHAGGAIQIFRIRSTASVQDLKDIPQVEIITKLPPLKPDREVVVRFTAPAYRKHFDLRTDANALYMTERRDRLDMGYASHFYPSTSMVSVANGRHQITCLTDVSIAVGSNNDGEWEFMLQRRTSKGIA